MLENKTKNKLPLSDDEVLKFLEKTAGKKPVKNDNSLPILPDELLLPAMEEKFTKTSESDKNK
ncbi:MAG: hypothetical protein AAB954_00975 [Patescibacteria group bacterium]